MIEKLINVDNLCKWCNVYEMGRGPPIPDIPNLYILYPQSDSSENFIVEKKSGPGEHRIGTWVTSNPGPPPDPPKKGSGPPFFGFSTPFLGVFAKTIKRLKAFWPPEKGGGSVLGRFWALFAPPGLFSRGAGGDLRPAWMLLIDWKSPKRAQKGGVLDPPPIETPPLKYCKKGACPAGGFFAKSAISC